MQFVQHSINFITALLLTLTPGAQYTEGVNGQPVSFFPHQIESKNDKTISKLIYRGLFRYDNQGNLVPDLAESWEISEDGLEYTITLKRDQFWSDNTPITADDVIYTAFKLPDLQYVGTDKVDDRKVKFILPNKFSSFLNLLTAGIMQNHSEETYSGLMPVSSGKFTVVKIEKSGPIIREIILKNNDQNSKIKKVSFKYYSNEEELVTAAKLGEIKAFLSDSTYEIENFNNKRFPLQGVYFALFLDTKNEKLSNSDTRAKLEKVFDKEAMFFDKGIPVKGPISRSIFTNERLEFNPHDERLKEDLNMNLTITIPDIQTHVETARAIRDIWENTLGVNVQIERVDPTKFVDEIITPRKYEAVLYGQEVSRDPSRYVNWHSTQTYAPGLNLSMYENLRVDKALELSREATDIDERVLHYNELQRVITEEVPVIFLYHPYRNFYVSTYVEGIGEKYTFTEVDRFLDFDKWSVKETN